MHYQEHRMQQQAEAVKKEAETSDKIAARAFAQSYLADLVPSVFGLLTNNGYFYDPVERGVEKEFMPWLMGVVDKQLHKSVLSRQLLDSMIREVTRARSQQFAELDALEAAQPELPEIQVLESTDDAAKPADGEVAGLTDETTPGDGTTDAQEDGTGAGDEHHSDAEPDDDTAD
jgi:hypothetical protein